MSKAMKISVLACLESWTSAPARMAPAGSPRGARLPIVVPMRLLPLGARQVRDAAEAPDAMPAAALLERSKAITSRTARSNGSAAGRVPSLPSP